MIHHVVVLRFRDDTTAADIRALHDALMALPGIIPEIRGYRLGNDARIVEGNWDFALLADFDSRDDYLVYRTHPAHLAVIERYIKPILKDRAVAQFDSED